MKKLHTKVIKWANEKGYKVHQSDDMTFIYADGIKFTIHTREGGCFRSVWGGWSGQKAGLYMGYSYNEKNTTSDHYLNQSDIISAMENKIKNIF